VLLHCSRVGLFLTVTKYIHIGKSTEAKKLFKPADDEVDALDAISNQMELLLNVINDCKGYWCVVSGLEKDDDLPAHQKFMANFYFVHFIISQNRDMCCEKAVQHMLLCGVKTGLRNWYLDFGNIKEI